MKKDVGQDSESKFLRIKIFFAEHPKADLILTLLFVFFVFFLALILFFIFLGNEEISNVCGDGTFYNTCSLDKPYYCEDGVLVQNSDLCGCPDGLKKIDGTCTSKYKTEPKSLVFKYALRGEGKELNLTLYGGLVDYLSSLRNSIDYQGSEIASRRDFKLKNLNINEQRQLLIPLVKEIQNAASDETDQVRIAVSLVQNILWNASDGTVNLRDSQTSYARKPYEVLYDAQGVCGEKSELLAFLLRELDYGVVIFYNVEENHESVGIKCPLEKSWHDSGYCFVETSAPAIITDTSIEYAGGITLDSEPEVLLISDGKSLPENLYEYGDAKNMADIREKNFFGILKIWKISFLKEKYGLDGEYNLG